MGLDCFKKVEKGVGKANQMNVPPQGITKKTGHWSWAQSLRRQSQGSSFRIIKKKKGTKVGWNLGSMLQLKRKEGRDQRTSSPLADSKHVVPGRAGIRANGQRRIPRVG